MTEITVYTEGKIIRHVICPDFMVEIQCEEGESYVEGNYSSDSYYINESLPIERPDMQPSISKTEVLADGIDEVVIINLPIPATVNVKEQIVEIDDGELVMTFDTSGEYKIKVESFPYLPFEEVIYAH